MIDFLITIFGIVLVLFAVAQPCEAPSVPVHVVHPVTNPHCGIVVEDEDDQLGFCPENDGPEVRNT
jgi:hypothetical protein